MAFKQEVNVPLLFTIGIISAIMILVVVIGMQAWYQSEEMNEVALKAQEATKEALNPASPVVTFEELRNQQNAALEAKSRWTDEKKKDRATIPIGEAIAYLTAHKGQLP